MAPPRPPKVGAAQHGGAAPPLPPAEKMSLLADEATLADAESEIASGTAGCVRFTIWDLAGQTVFYDLLHILLTSHALYVVCFDMADLTPSLSRPTKSCTVHYELHLTNFSLTKSGILIPALLRP
jgi:hypothetical protein